MIATYFVSKDFNGIWAVGGLSLSVKRRQILALPGQNDAGKSTTPWMLTALLMLIRGWPTLGAMTWGAMM